MTTDFVPCPICFEDIQVEIERPYTVRGGQACDWEPGYKDVIRGCRHTAEELELHGFRSEDDLDEWAMEKVDAA